MDMSASIFARQSKGSPKALASRYRRTTHASSSEPIRDQNKPFMKRWSAPASFTSMHSASMPSDTRS
ncbi:MAG: hypothetical protein CM15mP74_16810 [Halieaceae bacterium]|nr:MAG: hypothetical protein CM15mP74_16810 [Halieaceae bacterium]